MDLSAAEPATADTRSSEPNPDVDNRYKYKYKMDHKERGHAIIISNQIFDDVEISNRGGTEQDLDELCEVFNELKFKQNPIRNKKMQQMKEIMQAEAEHPIHKESDAFVCVILSHGCAGNKVYGTDGKTVGIDELVAPFKGDKCEALRGKPKLFFIQACQGVEEDPGTDLPETRTGVDSSTIVSSKIPTDADVLIAYATHPAYVSYRNEKDGSWFMQALCDVLKKETYAKMNHTDEKLDLQRILTRVNNKVAYEYESNEGNKQMPLIASALTKELYFT
ncbi:caspase-3-like [Tubulanus polymorphus]|uniref:caspase-3-like n=1 Tax=Tubulanus polymorphus TaxID=672921 RepID=UPI003DA3707B